MTTTNNATLSTVKGITDKWFHALLWVLLAVGIAGNMFVILWRCCKKNGKFYFLSVVIVSLAVADWLFCFHFVLQEILLVGVVFNGDHRNQTFTRVDAHVCLASTFTFYVSCNASAFTATGIAVYTLFAVKGRKSDKVLSVFIVICWAVSVALAGWGTSHLKVFLEDHKLDRDIPSDIYSLDVMFGCMGDRNMIIVPSIIASLNFVAATVCCVLYLMVCSTLRKTVVSFENTELKHLKVRLAVIALMNVFCWWPACVLYLYSTISGKTVFEGSVDPDITIPAFLLAATVSAANPVIYTFASRGLLKFVRRVCAVCVKRGAEERRPFLVEEFADGDVQAPDCCRWKYQIRELPTVTNETEQSSLFSDSTNRVTRVESGWQDDN